MLITERPLALRIMLRGWFTVAAVFLLITNPGAQEPYDYIVQFLSGKDQVERASVVQAAGAVLRFNYKHVDAAAVGVPNDTVRDALRSNPSVVEMIPDRLIYLAQGKGKPGGGGGGPAPQIIPAGVTRVGVPTLTSNGEGVGVAVLDTGVDLNHTDLLVSENAFNAFGLTNPYYTSCQDDEGHGTHIAGTIAARDNSTDVIGVAPKAGIYCVKVINGAGLGSDSTIMAGLDWVLDNLSQVPPIKVVIMSLSRNGSVDDNPALHDMIKSVDAAGITIVVAAGNNRFKEVYELIPAAYPEVLAIASTTALAGSSQCRQVPAVAADTASYFTTDGAGVLVSAPGEEKEDVNKQCVFQTVGILSTAMGGGTTRMSGSSVAAAHVAGIAARYYQLAPTSTSTTIRNNLGVTADRPGSVPLDSAASGYTFDFEREGIAKAP